MLSTCGIIISSSVLITCNLEELGFFVLPVTLSVTHMSEVNSFLLIFHTFIQSLLVVDVYVRLVTCVCIFSCRFSLALSSLLITSDFWQLLIHLHSSRSRNVCLDYRQFSLVFVFTCSSGHI